LPRVRRRARVAGPICRSPTSSYLGATLDQKSWCSSLTGTSSGQPFDTAARAASKATATTMAREVPTCSMMPPRKGDADAEHDHRDCTRHLPDLDVPSRIQDAVQPVPGEGRRGSKDCVIVPYFRAVLPQPIRRLDGCDLPTGCTCDRTSPPTLTVAPIVESVRGLPVSRQLVFHVRDASIVAVSASLPTALD